MFPDAFYNPFEDSKEAKLHRAYREFVKTEKKHSREGNLSDRTFEFINFLKRKHWELHSELNDVYNDCLTFMRARMEEEKSSGEEAEKAKQAQKAERENERYELHEQNLRKKAMEISYLRFLAATDSAKITSIEAEGIAFAAYVQKHPAVAMLDVENLARHVKTDRLVSLKEPDETKEETEIRAMAFVRSKRLVAIREKTFREFRQQDSGVGDITAQARRLREYVESQPDNPLGSMPQEMAEQLVSEELRKQHQRERRAIYRTHLTKAAAALTTAATVIGAPLIMGVGRPEEKPPAEKRVKDNANETPRVWVSRVDGMEHPGKER